MILGWRLGYLDEHYLSPLLFYLVVCYLRGIVHYLGLCLSFIDMDLELWYMS